MKSVLSFFLLLTAYSWRSSSGFQHPLLSSSFPSRNDVVSATDRRRSITMVNSRQSRPKSLQRIAKGTTTTTSVRGGADDGEKGEEINAFVSLVGRSTSILVAALCFLVLAWRRDGAMVAFFLGSISNAILSKVLKKLIKQTRPPELVRSENLRMKPSDGGMPSSHGMSLGFVGIFTALHQPWWTVIPIALFTGASLLYRVQVKLHTTEQVVVGVVVGSTNAYLFHAMFEEPLIHFLQKHVLNEAGVLPLQLLVIPALVGILVIGSFERRITNWINKRKENAGTAGF